MGDRGKAVERSLSEIDVPKLIRDTLLENRPVEIIAADLKYATVIVTNNDNCKLEEYFNEKGEPTCRYSGEWAKLREYDKHGNNIRNTSLDADGNPVMNTSGYAIEEREYNQNKQVITVRYFDTDNFPVNTPANGYGKVNLYDENGRISLITFIDISGNPMITSKGYAEIGRTYYENDGPEKGKVENELYYDVNGNPVKLSLGQYGVYKEYDECGRESVLTYLDADGNPLTTTKGYTTIARTFQADNSIATELYYDSNGEPCSLSEGQYGIKKTDGMIIYLDKNGKEQFNLKNLLYNHSRLIIVFALIVILISSIIRRKWNIILLLIYMCMIAYMTIMFRDKEDAGVNLQLFWSYRDLLTNGDIRADILKNIWLFIPLGAILYQIYPKCVVVFAPVLISILVEITQYFTGTGLCELDDIVSNRLGGWIGYISAKLLYGLKMNISNNRKGNI